MRIELVLAALVFFVGSMWLVPSQIMLATAIRRFRHITFHEFKEAAAFRYHTTRRLLVAGVGTGAILLLAASSLQERLAVAACVIVFICFFGLYLLDFWCVEREADRLQQEGLDKAR